MFTMDTLKALHSTMNNTAHFALLNTPDTDEHVIVGCAETQRALFGSIAIPSDVGSPEHLIIVNTTLAHLYKQYNIAIY